MTLSLRMNLKIDFLLNHEPLGYYGEEGKVFLRKNRGESLAHVLMKLMSYLMFYHEDLKIEASAQQHFKPDLLRVDLNQEPVQWVDCGQTTISKMDKISRKNAKTFIDIVKPHLGSLRIKTEVDRKITYPERIRYWTFRTGFLKELEALVGTKNRIVATVTADYGHLYLLVDDKFSLDTPILYKGGEVRPSQQARIEEQKEAFG